jgi:hypothetical protein
MKELAQRLGADGVPTLGEAQGILLAGSGVEKGLPLFPRLEWGEIDGA